MTAKIKSLDWKFWTHFNKFYHELIPICVLSTTAFFAGGLHHPSPALLYSSFDSFNTFVTESEKSRVPHTQQQDTLFTIKQWLYTLTN